MPYASVCSPSATLLARGGKATRNKQRPALPTRGAAPVMHTSATRRHGWLPIASAAVAGLLYALTLYRSVPGGDSGELILAASKLGVAHPPGYPLYTLLAHAATWWPWGSVATRVNSLSALVAALATYFLSAAVLRCCGNACAALLAGGLFAMAALVWPTAIAAEVFALNNVFCAGLLYHGVDWAQRLDDANLPQQALPQLWQRHLRRGCLWAGLGLCNHHTFIFAIFSWAGFVLQRLPLRLWRRNVAPALGYFLLGLSPYLYLPWAAQTAHQRGADCWADTASWQGFWDHFFRRAYGTFQLAGDALGQPSPTRLKWTLLGRDLARDTLYIGLALALYAAYRNWRHMQQTSHQRCFLLWQLGGLLIYCCVLLSLSNLDFSFPLYLGIERRFWQQPLLLVLFCAGLGWQMLCQQLPATAQALGVALLLLSQLSLNYTTHQRAHSSAFQDFAAAVLTPLEPHALLLASGDHVTSTLHYYQQYAQLRPDVLVVEQFKLLRPWGVQQTQQQYPQLKFPGAYWLPAAPQGTFNLQQLLAANSPQRTIYIVNGIRVPDASYANTHRLWPMGYVEKILPKSQELPLASWQQRAASGLQNMHPTQLATYPPDSWEHEILRQYWQAQHSLAAALYGYAQRQLQNTPSPTSNAITAIHAAVNLFEQVDAATQTAHLPSDSRILKNLGAAYQLQTPYAPQAHTNMRTTWQRYLQQAPPNDPDLPLITHLLQQPPP